MHMHARARESALARAPLFSELILVAIVFNLMRIEFCVHAYASSIASTLDLIGTFVEKLLVVCLELT